MKDEALHNRLARETAELIQQVELSAEFVAAEYSNLLAKLHKYFAQLSPHTFDYRLPRNGRQRIEDLFERLGPEEVVRAQDVAMAVKMKLQQARTELHRLSNKPGSVIWRCGENRWKRADPNLPKAVLDSPDRGYVSNRRERPEAVDLETLTESSTSTRTVNTSTEPDDDPLELG